MPHTRREFLALAARASTLALTGTSLLALLPGPSAAQHEHTVHAPAGASSALPLPGDSGLYGLLAPSGLITLTARAVPGLLPATGAQMLAYEAMQDGRTFHNPILVLNKGQEFRVRLTNALAGADAGPTIIHWHGVDCPWRQAGHPSYAVEPGGSYDYAFRITNRAGAYWYHPHPHGLTARQSYLGLAAFFLVRDAEDEALSRALDLRLGVTDIPVLLQDKRFDARGGLLYAPDTNDLLMGHMGAEVLANGARRPTLAASTRLYRLRLLNGSTARLFNLAFLRGGRPMPCLLIGNDGGLLDASREVAALFLAPGERADVLLDLRGLTPGETVTLANAAFDPMHREGLHGGHGKQAAGHGGGHASGHGGDHAALQTAPPLDEGADYPILQIEVRRAEAYDRTVPARLSALPVEKPAPAGALRRFDLALDRHAGRWTINGLTYDMAAAPVVVERRGPETWEFVGAADGMPHPMHLHGYFFRVAARRGGPEQVRRRAVDRARRLATDQGLKATVLVGPGETGAVVPDFGTPDYPGEQIFLLHCHNLEHEDQGMMLNVRVK